MKVSRRALAAEPFHALAFGERASQLEAEGFDVVRLSIGEPDFGAPAAVREAMRAAMDGRPLPYTPALGLPALRDAIADFYRERHGVVIAPSRIAITAGASAALLLISAATVDDGDEVLLADPSYPCNRELVQSFGGRVVDVATSTTSRLQLSTAAVEQAWTANTGAVMIASPSNPTGTRVPDNELQSILEFARTREAWRIVDEIYLDLADDTADGRRPHSALAIDDDAIVIGSFSKFFGMTGWRLGWCVLPETLVPVVERLAMNYFLAASTPVQIAALECFKAAVLQECDARRLELLERRALVVSGLEELGFTVAVPPDGAFYVYFDVSSTGLDAWSFCELALEQVHVALTPGRDFAKATADSHVRLSYAASREQLSEGLARLAQLRFGKGRLAHHIRPPSTE